MKRRNCTSAGYWILTALLVCLPPACETVIPIEKPNTWTSPPPPVELVLGRGLNIPDEEARALARLIGEAIRKEFPDANDRFSFNVLSSWRRHYTVEVTDGGNGTFTAKFQKRFGRWVVFDVDGFLEGDPGRVPAKLN
jgi:hypothetical protein